MFAFFFPFHSHLLAFWCCPHLSVWFFSLLFVSLLVCFISQAFCYHLTSTMSNKRTSLQLQTLSLSISHSYPASPLLLPRAIPSSPILSLRRATSSATLLLSANKRGPLSSSVSTNDDPSSTSVESRFDVFPELTAYNIYLDGRDGEILGSGMGALSVLCFFRCSSCILSHCGSCLKF